MVITIIDPQFTTRKVAEDFGNPDLEFVLDEFIEMGRDNGIKDHEDFIWKLAQFLAISRIIQSEDQLAFVLDEYSLFLMVDGTALNIEFIADRNSDDVGVKHGKPRKARYSVDTDPYLYLTRD